jgi:hypothetical protein
MLPKWHALFGFLFAYILYWFTSITLFQASLIFFASIFIDIDHYFWYVLKKKSFSLKKAYYFLRDKERLTRKLMLFHTIEFHLFVGLLGLVWSGFFYILAGMILHSIIDIFDLIYTKRLNIRIFCLIRS